MESTARADDQTAADSDSAKPQWIQRPPWQQAREQRLDRNATRDIRPESAKKRLHWRNPEWHSQQFGTKQRPVAPNVFIARPHQETLGKTVQTDAEDGTPRQRPSLFDDAPPRVKSVASEFDSLIDNPLALDNPFGDTPQAISRASHNNPFGTTTRNEDIFIEEARFVGEGPVEDVFTEQDNEEDPLEDVFAVGNEADEDASASELIELVNGESLSQVDSRAFISTNEQVGVELPLADPEGLRVAQSSELMGNGQDLQKYRLRPEDDDKNKPMWQLDGGAGRAKSAAKTAPSFDDLDFGDLNSSADADSGAAQLGNAADDSSKANADPFQDDLKSQSGSTVSPTGQLPGDDESSFRGDLTSPDKGGETEPNLFPALDQNENQQAEQDMLDDILQERGQPTEDDLFNQRQDEVPGAVRGRDDTGADKPLEFKTNEDSSDVQPEEGNGECAEIYNGRNCCGEDAVCSRHRTLLHEFTLDKISLDIAPPFAAGEDDLEIRKEKRLRQLAKSESRIWTDRQGKSLVTGQFYDISNGNAIILRDDSTKVAIRLRDLSQDALCFVNSWWQLPAECRVSAGDYQLRDWTETTFTWKASALCHKPLYFEDAQLERYGHSAGPLKQPVLSGAHFFANVILLPYNIGLHPSNECRYALGYYRPGSCAPWLLPAFPLSIEGAAMQTIAVTGLIAILP